MDVVGMYRCVTGTTENQVIHYLKTTTTTKVNKMQEVLPAGNKPNTSQPFPPTHTENKTFSLLSFYDYQVLPHAECWIWCQYRLDVDYENFNNRFQQNRLLKDVEFPHLHTKYSLGVTFQWPQQQAALGIAHADSAVIRSDQKQPASALLSCAQAAHASWAVALEHIQLFQSLKRSKRMLLERREGIFFFFFKWTLWHVIIQFHWPLHHS